MVTKSLTAFFALILLVCCAYAVDEREYKDVSRKLRNMLLELEAIPVETREIGQNKEGSIFMSDYSKRAEFAEKKKSEWLLIAQKLNNIAKSYPKSEWADDSLFCLFLFTKATFSEGPHEFDIIVTDALNKLIYSYSEIHLEKWTEELFGDVFLKNFYVFIEATMPKELSSVEKLREMLRFSLAVKLSKLGKTDESMKLMKELMNKYPETAFEKMIQDRIEFSSRSGDLKNFKK